MAVNLTLLVVEIAVPFVAFALALFLPAGTVAWRAGWSFLVLFFGFVVAVTSWLVRHNPGLLRERMTGLRSGQEAWDKVLLRVTSVFFFAWLMLMPLDAVRFQWSRVPVWLQAVGAIVLACSFCLFFLTFRENPYLSPAVRIQEERGQTVISTGPYHYVRHPMYSAFVLLVLGTPLLLGSWCGLPLGLVLVLMVATRAVLEERTLRKDLQGYDVYMAQVRYRFIPNVW
jgi:protein-S-isoprenylcysteine O-methyltransferase Ste14